MTSFRIEHRWSGRVVWTTHLGEVGVEEILEAIDEEGALLDADPSISVVVFDYTGARMTPLSREGVARCAARMAAVLEPHDHVALMGVVPNPLEFGMSRMFQIQLEMGLSKLAPGQVVLVRTADEASRLVEDWLAAART